MRCCRDALLDRVAAVALCGVEGIAEPHAGYDRCDVDLGPFQRIDPFEKLLQDVGDLAPRRFAELIAERLSRVETEMTTHGG